jgi:hypothetical protein
MLFWVIIILLATVFCLVFARRVYHFYKDQNKTNRQRRARMIELHESPAGHSPLPVETSEQDEVYQASSNAKSRSESESALGYLILLSVLIILVIACVRFAYQNEADRRIVFDQNKEETLSVDGRPCSVCGKPAGRDEWIVTYINGRVARGGPPGSSGRYCGWHGVHDSEFHLVASNNQAVIFLIICLCVSEIVLMGKESFLSLLKHRKIKLLLPDKGNFYLILIVGAGIAILCLFLIFINIWPAHMSGPEHEIRINSE